MGPEQTPEYPTLTHYQGIEIISTEPAVGPHPRTKEPSTFRTAIKVLLGDGREAFICPYGDYDHATSVMSVNNHYVSAHIPTDRRRYKPAVLREIVRAVTEAKAAPGRDFMDRAAAILNARGVRTVSNETWTSANLSGLYRKYHEEFQQPRRRGPGRPKTTRAAGVTRTTKTPSSLDGLLALAELMVQEIRDLKEAGLGVVDAELVRKAAKWDAFVALRDDH